MLNTRETSAYALYQYDPALVPAIVVAGLYLLGAIAHSILVRKLQAKTFIPFVIGCCSKFRLPYLHLLMSRSLTSTVSGSNRIRGANMVPLQPHRSSRLYHPGPPNPHRTRPLRRLNLHGFRPPHRPRRRPRTLHHPLEMAYENLRPR